jgi:hypothetical protein
MSDDSYWKYTNEGTNGVLQENKGGEVDKVWA